MRRLAGLIAFGAALALAQHAGAVEHGEASHGDAYAFWKWINFLILAVLLGYLILKTARPFFRQRAASIVEAIQDALETRRQAEARAAAIEKKISNLGAEIEALRTSGKKEMEAEAARLSEESRRAILRMEESARQEIASMAKHAENELRAKAAALALDEARTKIASRMTPHAQASLVSRFVSNLRGPAVN